MGCKIYVGNLSYQTREDALKALFESYGEVTSVHFAKDRETGRFRGFAFLEMTSAEDVAKAVASLDGNDFDGRQLRVKEAEDRPRPSRDE